MAQRSDGYRYPSTFSSAPTLVYARLPATIFLRAADALHLSTASENGFREIHSNDAKLLSAAPHFGLRGVNVLD